LAADKQPKAPLISLRKTVTELDRLEELHRAAVSCYSEALRSSERHVVELEAAEAAHFRSQLQAFGTTWKPPRTPGNWSPSNRVSTLN
jgi:hypothetical protein